ncbi:MAG: preprotein translocase subunit SecA [Chloroflexota bacterium]|jgi:preprotein translocase subunit SecA
MRKFLSRLVGTSQESNLKPLLPVVERINELEAHYRELSDEQIRAEMAEVRDEVREAAPATDPSEEELHTPDSEARAQLRRAREKADVARMQAALDEVLPDVFAAAREVSRRKLDMRHFDVQLQGGIVLHQGKIAEMKTGEGKTLVAPLAAALNAMSGWGVHIVTVNDYLAKRDPQWMGPIYHGLGLSVGIIQHDTAYLYDPDYQTSDETLVHLRPVERKAAYDADVTYATNNELGFDYLRDNMVQELSERVQRRRYFAIVDEVDNILIDEARTPLIISGAAGESGDLYKVFARLVPRLEPRPENAEEGGDYYIDLKEKAVAPTEEGIAKIEKMLNIRDLYGVETDPRLPRHFEQSLRAHALFKRDRDYIVKNDEIVIVDEFTGRQMPGRRWSEGLHQAIEAKEGVRVQRESMTMATVTFQNYFRLYDKLSGMTGTAMTEQEEFYKIYGLEVMAIPTHLPMIREDFADLVYRDEEAKFGAVIDEIVEHQEAGRPVLVGTTSVEKSEQLSRALKKRGVRHEVLNAKFHEKEAPIVAQAGHSGAVTIATNMAGRGTDIKLGGDPAGLASQKLHARGLNPAEVEAEVYEAAYEEARAECDEDHERVVAAGGLHIIGTERHEARRIDNQLRGRSGRQGDPGSSRYFLSLEDALLKRFANDRVTALMERMGLEGEVAIESRMVSRTVENAQSRVEGHNFDIRKRIVEYDDVINKQRERIYEERDKVLHNEDLSETVLAFVEQELAGVIDAHLGEVEAEWDFEGLSESLGALGLTGDAFSADALDEQGGRDDIVEYINDRAADALDAREQEYGEEVWALVERAVLLRAIDTLWVEHLTELEDFRRGVGLRGYGGRDPLVEFKREAFSLYDELRGFIQHQVASTIFRVSVQRREEAAAPGEPQAMPTLSPEQLAKLKSGGNGAPAQPGSAIPARSAGGTVTPATSSGGSATATSGATVTATTQLLPGLQPQSPRNVQLQKGDQQVDTGQARSANQAPDGEKLGRNDPCWCGSGKKYKRCHGAS